MRLYHVMPFKIFRETTKLCNLLDDNFVQLKKIICQVNMLQNKNKYNKRSFLDCCTTKGSLKIHMDAFHKGKKSYKCSIFDHNSTTKSKLKRHINTVHDGKKPHKRSICDNSYTTKASLKIHMDAVHEERKPHQCSIVL